MRKILSIFAIVALLVAFSGTAEAAALRDTKYTIDNSSGTSSLTTLVPIALIIPNKSRIVSVIVTPTSPGTGAHYENIVAVYDASSIAGLIETKAMEGEVERNDADSGEIEWKRPLKIYNGCVIAQGAKTVVNIEFEDIPQP